MLKHGHKLKQTLIINFRGMQHKMLLLKYEKLKQIQIYQKMKKGISVLLFVQKNHIQFLDLRMLLCQYGHLSLYQILNTCLNQFNIKMPQFVQLLIQSLKIQQLADYLTILSNFGLFNVPLYLLNLNGRVQTIDHQNFANALSINKEGNKKLSCGRDNQILIMEKLQNMEWQMVQRIQLDGEGFRISFITNEYFAFQARIPKNHLLFYQLDFNTKQYKQSEDNEVAGVGGNQTCALFFPMFYIDSKQIPISKNGQNINSIKLQFSSQIESYDLIQSIKFGLQPNGWLFGTVSQDGELLITWDFSSRSIQIRKYKQKL